MLKCHHVTSCAYVVLFVVKCPTVRFFPEPIYVYGNTDTETN